jgi:predicted nucleic-acid-binding protein
MKIAADTNVLVRAITDDDEQQGRVARAQLTDADMVALAIPVLCELVWVLSRGYGNSSEEIAATIRRLIDSANVVVDRPAAEAGLDLLEAGGDFADGAIAYEGSWLGAQTFVSFDRKAVTLLAARGKATRLLS